MGGIMRLLLPISLVFVCTLFMVQAIEITEKSNNLPHLTPSKLVGSRFSKDTFGDIKVAIVGYCPPPGILAKYHPKATTEQYFIHVSPSSVQICRHGDIKFLSIFHVYGGPVSSALIEELGYYGIKYVLAYGLAGGLGTKDLKMGDAYLVENALAKDGTTIHYTGEQLIASDKALNSTILKLAKTNPELSKMVCVQAVTGDAIYREYDEQIEEAVTQNCDVINCDSSHLFAVSKLVGIASTECGIISDVTGKGSSEWDSTLSVMLSDEGISSNNPLERVGKIVELYVEKLIPEILMK
jgi:uridine phosphorylase